MHKPNPIVPKLGHDPHSSPQPGTPIPDWITLHPKITHFDFGHRNPAQTVAAKAAEFVQGASK